MKKNTWFAIYSEWPLVRKIKNKKKTFLSSQARRATECSVTAVVWPHTDSLLRHLSSYAMNVMTAAADSADEVHALLRPQVTNILLAFTENSLCYQIHCAAGQITCRQLQPLLRFCTFYPWTSTTYLICQVKTSGEKWPCSKRSHRGPNCSVSLCDW